MAVFTWEPSYEASESSRPRVRKFQAGDGYEARVRFGLNTDPKTWSLTFAERSDAEAEEITDFLEAQAGVAAFDWVPPRGSSGKYVCEDWQVSMRACNFNTITAKFQQVFEP